MRVRIKYVVTAYHGEEILVEPLKGDGETESVIDVTVDEVGYTLSSDQALQLIEALNAAIGTLNTEGDTYERSEKRSEET